MMQVNEETPRLKEVTPVLPPKLTFKEKDSLQPGICASTENWIANMTLSQNGN